jgi:hypothetical protein
MKLIDSSPAPLTHTGHTLGNISTEKGHKRWFSSKMTEVQLNVDKMVKTELFKKNYII